uniref:Uncharacterized protein n=1 Tax=Caenorhabditis japonica TaxID=281687 RepID=A0A8R1EC02_CAEJA
MTSTWDTTLKKRVERAARFDDNTFYINYLRYFDVLGQYIIPPDPHIAKAINVYGYNHLMEIEIYDEHRDYLEALRVRI